MFLQVLGLLLDEEEVKTKSVDGLIEFTFQRDYHFLFDLCNGKAFTEEVAKLADCTFKS